MHHFPYIPARLRHADPSSKLWVARGALVGCVSVVAALGLGCGNGEGRPDEELHGLVHAEEKKPKPIDLDRASTKVKELSRALAQPHATLASAVGAHRIRIGSTVLVTEGESNAEELKVDTEIQYDADGNYHALSNNSKDYGREIYYVDGTLYLKPRYAPVFHKRAPVDDAEPKRLLDALCGELPAYFEVVAAGAELVDRGHAEVSGRAGRKVEIKQAPETAHRQAEESAQRQWRTDVEVLQVKGDVVLDADTATLLLGTLEAKTMFERDGRRFQMKLDVKHEVSDIGSTPAVEAPPDDQVRTTPEQNREAFDREELLKDIARPARKPPTPKSTEDSAESKSSAK